MALLLPENCSVPTMTLHLKEAVMEAFKNLDYSYPIAISHSILKEEVRFNQYFNEILQPPRENPEISSDFLYFGPIFDQMYVNFGHFV